MKKIAILLIIAILSNANDFLSIYTKNKKEGIGNYITVDFLLNNLYLHKKEIITNIEQKQLEPNLKKFSYRLLRATIKNRVTDNRLLVYLTTLNLIQNTPLPKLPTHIISQAKEELAKIKKASAQGYKKFKNSGRLKDKQSYFRALTYITKVPFFINPSTMTHTDINSSNENLKIGLELAKTIKNSKELKQLYFNIDKKLQQLFGRADDLGVMELNHYQLNNSIEEIRKALNKKRNYPKIIGEQVDITGVKRQDIAKNLLSFRLFSSRYTLDSYLFSRVVFPYTLSPLHKKANSDRHTAIVNGKRVRVLPSIKDIELLFKPPKRETYQNYFKNLKLVQRELFHGLKLPLSLYEFDFRIYKELLKAKKIDAFRGYYTQNRYLAYAYAKKSHTPTQRSVTLGKKRDKALLEKNIYSVLDSMIDELNFLYQMQKDKKTKEFIEILKKLKKISTKKHYTKDDIELLNNLNVSFQNIIDDRFRPISVELHYDGNSHRGVVEILKEPKVVTKDKLRGAKYLHIEKLINKSSN